MKILRNDQISDLANKADERIKLKGLAEALDGIIIKATLSLGVNAIEKWKNKEGEVVITDDICMAIQNAVDLLLGGAYGEAIAALQPIADKYIDFKKLDDDTEAALLGVVFFMLKTIVAYFETPAVE